MHPLLQNEEFENLSEESKDRENSGRHFNTHTNIISLINDLDS